MDRTFPTGSSRSAAFSGMNAEMTRQDASQIAWLTDGDVPIATKLVVKLDGPRLIEDMWHDLMATCWPGMRRCRAHLYFG